MTSGFPTTPPAGFEGVRAATWRKVADTTGYLSEREARFLMPLAACTPADGVILEIGSFKGRSTVALASIAKHYDRGKVIAVDPHTAPSATDPDLQGQTTSFDDFLSNVHRAGVADVVEPHRMYSRELAPNFDRPIRVLWIDGDHTTRLRSFHPPVIARVQEDRTILDLRTVEPADDATLADAVRTSGTIAPD